MRTLALALLLAATVGGSIPASTTQTHASDTSGGCGPDGIVICHTAGNSVRRRTITIPSWAVAAHLEHGDTLGPCGAANQPPLADAGPDQTAPVGATVLLDGSGSTDGDGDPLTFLWSFQSRPAGSAAALSDPAAVRPTFLIDQPGAYVLQLVVHDGQASSAADAVQVSTVNSPPVADAGANQTVLVSETVTLDGSGSTDADGDPLSYQWQLSSRPDGSAAALSDPAAVEPSFVADLAGTYVVELVVHDGLAPSVPDAVTISTENTAPVADAGPDQSAGAGDVVELDGSGSADPDGTPLTFSWALTSRPAGSAATLSDPLAVDPTFVADVPGVFVAQLVVSDGLLNSAPDTAVIAVEADPVVTVAATDPAAAEAGPDPGTFTVTRVGPTGGALTVSYDVAGTALPGADYVALPGAVTIPDGAASAEVTVAPLDDLVFEGPETVALTLSPDPAYILGAQVTAIVGIADDERPVVTIVATDANAAEAGPDPGTFTLSRTGPPTDALTVRFAVGGLATSGVDYEAIGTEVTIPPGAAAATVTLTPIDDTLVEGAETATLILAADAAYTVGTPGQATVTIADDDVPVVTVVATDPDATEAGPTNGVFTFSRTGSTANALVVSFTRSGTATGGNTGALDYAPIGTQVTIPAGASGADVVLAPLPDNRLEGPETATLTINAGGNIVVGIPNVATVTIADDPPVATVLATDPDAAEAGADPGVFTLRRTGGNLAAPLAIRTSFGGTAANGSDFGFVSGLVTVPANATEATLTIVPLADNRVEGPETMEVTIIPSTGVDTYVIGTPDTATVTIADDPPVVSVVATDPLASEAGPDPGTFTFTRSGGDVATQLAVLVGRGGTATNGVDYEAIGGSNFLVPIPAGEVSAVVTITPLADTVVEPDETVVLTVQPSASYVIAAPGTATVTIADGN